MARLAIMLDQSGLRDAIETRNPGEVFRHFLTCMSGGSSRKRCAPTRTRASWSPISSPSRTVRRRALRRLARSLVRPVRRQVEAFGFCAAGLDIRQNALVINRTLQAIWRQREGGREPPAADSDAWKSRLLAELAQPLEVATRLRRLAARSR